MEKERVSKRLYVGGLGHTVSKDELEERFGKFGHVLDAEIITRKDDQGNPMKTFAYVSVSISDADLRKCMSVLNKSKWKGGTLQMELAKESFLHRLAAEREESKLKKEKPQKNGPTCLLESLKKTGVVDFHMKAVPGTEVPEHKKWVVGKFGRVLPVLHLRNQQKNKIVKYDPSKYCHNLRKLEPDLAQAAPVSQLTWHLEGRDDCSTKRKRQGEFPGMKKPPKKLRQLGSEPLNGAAVLSSGCQSHPKHTSSPQLHQKSNTKPSDKSKLSASKSLNNKISGRGLLSDPSNFNAVTAPNNRGVSDSSDIDPEEEIRAMVKEAENQKARNVETERDLLEIVGDNFGLKYNSHWSLSNIGAMKKVDKGCHKVTMECDNGYDSADTDEIIAESKTPDPNSSKTAILENSTQGKEENEEILASKKRGLVNGSSLKTQNVKEHIERKKKIKKSKVAASQGTAVNDVRETSGGESSYSESEQGESETSSDYESMMQNCYRLDLSLDDFKALAATNTGTPAEESDGAESSGQGSAEENPKGNVKKPKLSKFHPAAEKKGICPEDVLTDILAGENEESSKGQNNSQLKYQPFRGMGSLCVRESTKGSTELKKNPVEGLGVEACTSYREKSSKKPPKNLPLCSPEGSSKNRPNMPCEQHKELSAAASLAYQRHQPLSRPRLQGKNKDVSSLQDQNSEHGADQSDSGSSDRDSNAAGAQKPMEQQLKSPKLLSKTLKKNVSNKSPECEANKCEKGKTSLLKDKELCLHATAAKEPTTEKQVQDNQRRLAALEERHRERELQKKLIQGALSNLDSQPAGKHKHIIFDSDVENEAEVDETWKKDASLGNKLGEGKPAAKPSGQLFDSSEDEQDDMDDERFLIKPQFQGKAGEKLLQLQSRFGTDERFRMDARFLESDSEEEETNSLKADEEEELAAEKKKNLQILGSLLNINLEQPKANKTAKSAKKFKDINALRYDPTRQDHAVFERKPSAAERKSKAKKKKKKEETEKPPQVSEEIYYNIAADFKDLFGSSKSKSEKNEEIPWDKEDGEDSAPPNHVEPVSGNNAVQESSGFKFSFFGDTEKSDIKEEPYILEAIKPAKVTWQEDPRFQDSSSEDDDEPEASETEKDQEMFLYLAQTESTRSFFFSRDDERLREGPKLFCRSVDLSEEKDGWEDRRRLLLEECRKKHKDAKRKVKAKQ